ncbi:MAG: LysM peptidoglycan-binding domain-containing protein, partial [Candidatus Eremiobacteraeota bacterium]|nr:LysM peptidoglycan-binding domain-containing protein [Candidatus Eremiobacteraeota bacterium]
LPDESAAAFLFRRWFLLVAQGAVQAASDLLNSYSYTVADPSTESLASIAAEFNTVTFTHAMAAGESLESIARDYDAQPHAVAAANLRVDVLSAGAGTLLSVPVGVRASYRSRAGDTLASIADEFGTSVAAVAAVNGPQMLRAADAPLEPGTDVTVPVEVTPATIVAANAATTGLLRVWGPSNGLVIADGQPQRPVFSTIAYQIVDGDSIDTVANRFGLTSVTLMTDNPQTTGLLRPGGVIALGDMTTLSRTGDTIQTIANFWGFANRIDVLLAANAPGIPLVAQTMIIPGNPDTVQLTQGQTLEAFAQANGTTVDELLSVNAAILVVPNTTVKLPNVTYTATGATISIAYLADAGATLAELAERFYGSDTPDNENAIQHANPAVTFPLAAPTVLSLIPPETSANLCGTFAVPPQTLWSSTNTANTALLAPRGVFTIPPIEPVITADDSFNTLASRYALTLDQLADQLANTTGLFHDGDPVAPILSIPYVPSLPLDQLVTEVAASESANETSAQASRFLMAGLRIPNPSDPLFVANPHDPTLRTYPLLSLTGQEFAAPTSDPTSYTYAFTKTGTADWLTVPGGTLTFPLSADEAAQITEFTGITLTPQVQRLERIALSSTVADQRALQTSYRWQAGEMPVLPPSGTAAGAPTLWELPDALRSSVATISPVGVPYGLTLITPTPGGSPQGTAVTSARWATTVEIRISLVPSQTSSGPNLSGTYLVQGADQTGTETLLALMRELEGGGGATLYLLYAPDASNPQGGGLISDAVDRSQVVLVKTNLSTLSNGTPVAAASERSLRVAALATESSYTATLAASDSLAFVELLWECSVVRSGGFYLTYSASDGTTFPGAIFDASGETTLTLVALLDAQPSVGASLLTPLNTAVVIGDNIDTSRSTLFARATVHTIVAGETLTTIASTFPLVQPAPTPASLATANATVHHLLDPNATILVNGVAIPILPLDTFESIATDHGTDPATLGTENATRAIFQPSALIQPLAGMLTANATLRPGNTGFFVTRTDPQQPPTLGRALGTSDAQSELDTLFNLLGFSIVANTNFSVSGEGMPAGPTYTEGDPLWNYVQTLAAYTFARPEPLQQIVPASPALPLPAENPYAGIAAGAELDLNLVFHDVHGNLTSYPALHPPVPVGYTDDIIPVSSWPSTATSYAFAPVDGGTAQLAVDWRFSATSYMPAPGADYAVTHDKARVDRQQIITAYYQTRMPNVTFGLSTSFADLAGDDASRSTTVKLAEQGYLAEAYVFITNAAELPAITVTTAAAPNQDTLASVATTYETTAGALAQANASADAAALFGNGTLLSIPQYYRVATGDTLHEIATAILPNGTEPQRIALVGTIGAANANLPLNEGTGLIAKARTVTIDSRDGSLASTSAIGTSQHVAILGDALSGLTGLGTANTPAVLGSGITLTYQDAPSLVVTAGQTLADVVAIFQKSVADANADAVAQTNRYVQRFFADAQVVTLPNYVAQPGDTLASVASAIGPVGSGDPPTSQLLIDNIDVSDVFPPGTALFYGTITYAIQPGDTLQLIADAFAITVEDLGSRNASVALEANQHLQIPYLVDAHAVATSSYRADGTESIDAIVASYAAWASDPNALTAYTDYNQYVSAQFDPAKTITIGGQSVTPTLDSTIATLAASFGLMPVAFVTAIAPTPGYLRAGATILAVAMTSSINEKLSAVAARYRCTVGELADANASVYQLVAAGQTIVVTGYA